MGTGGSFPEVRWPGLQYHHSSPFKAVVRNECHLQAFTILTSDEPIPVAARSKAWACDRSLAVIAGLNPAGGMYVGLL